MRARRLPNFSLSAGCTLYQILRRVRAGRELWLSGVEVVDRVEVEVLLVPAEYRLPRADVEVARVDAGDHLIAETLSAHSYVSRLTADRC